MWPAFPTSDYCEGSAPTPSQRPTTDLPATGRLAEWRGRLSAGSHVHRITGRRRWCPAIPLQPRHGYAAGLLCGLRVEGHCLGHGVARSTVERACTADRPISARLQPVHRLRGFHHWFARATPSRLACRTRPIWQCWTVPSLSGLLSACTCISRLRLPPASPICCDRPEVGSCLPPGYPAPRGARRRRCSHHQPGRS